MGILASFGTLLASLLGLQGLGLSGCATLASCFTLTATSEDGQEVAINNPTFGGDEVAQKFVTGTTAITATAIKLKLKRIGALTSGTIIAYIVADDGAGSPSTVTTEPSATLTLSSTVPTTSGFTVYTVALSASQSLTASTSYWIRIRGTYGQSGSDYITQAASNLNGYTSGNAMVESSTPNSFGSGSLGDTRDLAVGISCRNT